MDTFDAIYQRRSIKQFDAQFKLSPEEEAKLLEAAIQAPTSFNIQHWRFVIVRDSKLRQKIRKEYGNDQAQMTDASLLIIMTADSKAWKKNPERYWVNAPEEVADLLVNWMAPFHEGREWLQRDEAQRSIGMAMQTLMLAARGLGLHTCPQAAWIQFQEPIFRHLQIPEDEMLVTGMCLGYADDTAIENTLVSDREDVANMSKLYGFD